MQSAAYYAGLLNLPQIRAALDVIAWSEGADYNTLYGGGTFSNYAAHPSGAITAGGYTSTAAGRYQFLSSTWNSLSALGLPDFSPQSQDIGAIALMDRRGVLGDVLNGDFQSAVTSGGLGKEWASFPYSPYGQSNHSLSQVLNYYNGALGVYNAGADFVPATTPTDNGSTDATDYISTDYGSGSVPFVDPNAGQNNYLWWIVGGLAFLIFTDSI